ncbi:Na+/melibiose symporter [Proteiniborus ethanoligenes]|uniref:Na+/melibiose symporter n=1 Tax=Proteiniborus ethanoligenes TaxID=415015 RepID=A0A1H3L9U4_9FIRM|nr:MFS transporter [Proteiniborus ethanoligenes]TAH63525.1 MAG: MFS transporter [Gottschalkiaceae bacterium]SDY61297.1 Na+/melibiose symporter [Proteiniborus ethanoligenes]
MKLNYKKTFILGLGFFVISLVWSLYNFYVPLFLRDFLDSQFWINAIMTFDNLLAVSLIPVIGAMSDSTRTRFGRRMPYLIIGIPISAVLFSILPFYTSFISIVIILFFLNLSMAIYRAPTIALMPDITPAPLRSKANGVINFMGGLASVLVLFVGAYVYEFNKYLLFILTSILMIVSLILLRKFIKEPDKGEVSKEEKINVVGALLDVVRNKDKTALYLLFAIFFWFVAYQGVEATFSNYSVYFLGTTTKTGSIIMSSFAGMFLAFAIPSGFIASKVGKKRTILMGITGLIVVFLILSTIRATTTFLSLPFNVIMMILMGIGGFFWALININSYPMVVECTTEDKVGTYTGLYYFFSSLAAILGPLMFGFFVDIIGFEFMFIVSSFSFVLAFIFIFFTKPKGN